MYLQNHLPPVASHSLCTSEEGTRRPQKHVFFSEVVREAQVHQWPGQEVSARWLRIIQSWQEAETSPDPNQTAAPERELSLGKQGHKSYSCMGKKPALLSLGESTVDGEEGKAAKSSRGLAL